MKTQLINRLLYKYQGILSEVIAQKGLFATNQEFIALVVKLQMYINLVQGIQLKGLSN